MEGDDRTWLRERGLTQIRLELERQGEVIEKVVEIPLDGHGASGGIILRAETIHTVTLERYSVQLKKRWSLNKLAHFMLFHLRS